MDGDTFFNASCSDGVNYVALDDTQGFGMGISSALAFGKFTSLASPLQGAMVNSMSGYGSLGGAWKESGLTCLPAQAGGDVLLMTVIQQQTSGSYCHTSGGLIKSYDHGVTWTNWTHPSNSGLANGDPPSTSANMFTTYNVGGALNVINPVLYAVGGDPTSTTDNQNTYVYFTSGANGKACGYSSGSDLLLLRVPRTNVENLSQSDYQVYIGGDGTQDTSWSSNLSSAVPVYGGATPTWVSQMNCGLPIGCILTESVPGASSASVHWSWLVAPHPWGPFVEVRTDDWPSTGLKLSLMLHSSISNYPNLRFLSTGDYATQPLCSVNPTASGCYYQIWIADLTVLEH